MNTQGNTHTKCPSLAIFPPLCLSGSVAGRIYMAKIARAPNMRNVSCCDPEPPSSHYE